MTDDNEPVTLEHSILVRCLGVAARASKHPARLERIFSVVLSEVDEKAEGLVGQATLRDVPHEIAKRLSEGLSRNLKYRLSFSLEALPDPQQDLFRSSTRTDLPVDFEGKKASSIETVTISSPGLGSVTTTPAGLERAAQAVRRRRKEIEQ